MPILVRRAISVAIACCLVGFSWFWAIAPAAADYCFGRGDRQICLTDVRRSAKHPWEYWVVRWDTNSAKGDSSKERKVREVYNCRDRLRTTQAGETVRFQTDDPQAEFCRVLQKR
ncbi:MAG: hypothetical protein HC925_07540 [Coleofasciculaceae cyanobacterium SM2_3_26]|nr:hypothetical protein [Coleofasciculaceae cyanobacterium SM2_3_26]